MVPQGRRYRHGVDGKGCEFASFRAGAIAPRPFAPHRPLYQISVIVTHFMGADVSPGQARRAARCGASGKRRNAPRGDIRPTEGRPHEPSRGVAARLWCASTTAQPAPSKTARAGGEMSHYHRDLVLQDQHLSDTDLTARKGTPLNTSYGVNGSEARQIRLSALSLRPQQGRLKNAQETKGTPLTRVPNCHRKPEWLH